MACSTTITAGIPRGCRENAGGLKRVFIATRSMLTGGTASFTPTAANDYSGITSITMAGSNKFYEFVPNKMSSNVVENIQANIQNGTQAYEQVLTLMFAKNEYTLRNQVKLLAQNELVVITEDYNGIFHLLGEFNGLELNGGNSATGTALSDMNGWTLTLTGNEPYPARTVTSAAVVAVTPTGTVFV